MNEADDQEEWCLIEISSGLIVEELRETVPILLLEDIGKLKWGRKGGHQLREDRCAKIKAALEKALLEKHLYRKEKETKCNTES